MSSNQGNKIAIIVTVTLLVIAGLIGAWYFLAYLPEQKAKEQARLEQLAEEEAEKERQALAARNKKNYDSFIKNGDAAFAQEDWNAALTAYAGASNIYPNQQYPKDQLAIVNANLNEIAEREARRAAGVVEQVTSPTGRFYVIVSSSVDEDLAMDYATKLAKQGNSMKVIGPDAVNWLFNRVAIDDYATREEAQAATSNYAQYGDGVWVLKY